MTHNRDLYFFKEGYIQLENVITAGLPFLVKTCLFTYWMFANTFDNRSHVSSIHLQLSLI